MSERVGVLVKNGIVNNIVIWGDESEAQYEAEGWDTAMEVTDLTKLPGIGWTYNETDGFRPPQPYPSWTWSNKQLDWVSPVPRPVKEGKHYEWDETGQTWESYTAIQDPITGNWTITKD